MANPVRINAATLNRPGVFVAQATTGSLPEPIATHAVGYIFGTTPTEDYYGQDAINTYSSLEPYKPTQISSVDDYLARVGGEVPVGNKGAMATYDSIKAFFDNVGVNGILYLTRVTPTPETVVDISASAAGTNYNAFAFKVNGRYYGTPIGLLDEDGTEIRVITTSGLDQVDNARDVFIYLADNGDGFSDYYKIEQNATEATQGQFRIFSKDAKSLPQIERAYAYQFNQTTYASRVDLMAESGVVKLYTSVKEINFRCVSRNQANREPIKHISGSALSSFIKAKTTRYVAPVAGFNATADTITLNSSVGLSNGDRVVLEGTDIGTLATAAFNTVYYVVNKSGNNIQLSLTSGGAVVNFSGAPGAEVTVHKLAYNVSTDSGQIIEDFLVDQGIYASSGAIPGGKIVGVSLDETSGLAAPFKWIDASAVYWEFISSAFTVFGGGTTVPGGDSTLRTGYLPDSVQVFYVNIAGENRAIIINGANITELTTELTNEIKAVLTEKGLEDYYDVEAVTTGTGTLYPNNGLVVSNLISAAGNPYIRPDVAEVLATPGHDAADLAGANGFYSHDYVLRVKITSKNGISSPVYPGVDRSGAEDANVVKLNSFSQAADYDSYKVTATAKANDFVYAIERGVDSTVLAPGFLFAPEAYSVLSYDAGSGDFASQAEARQERLKITQALLQAAEGKIGQTEGIVGTQHVAIIDCGGDETTLNKVQDELDLVKSTVGVPFGHAAYYAPYIKNQSDRFVPPSGYVAGIACSRYINEGFQQPPAGARYPLRGATGLKFDISSQQQEVTYALGLNPVRSLPNRGIVVWGARTLSSNPLFRFVNTRAILNVLVDVLGRSFDDILFEQIDSAGTVYARVKSIASQVCGQFYRQGALFGSRPEQAYLVVCSSANNSTVDLENGTVRLDVYVATSPTLERLLVTIVRTPAGQVAQLSDSFSRNQERYSALLNTTTTF